MAPKQKQLPIRPGTLARQVQDMHRCARITMAQSSDHPPSPEHVDSTFLDAQITMPSPEQPETGSSSSPKRRSRGKNKNTALSKLTPCEKLTIQMTLVGKAWCDNSVIFSRHIGIVVRNGGVISHRLLRWSDLSTDAIDHLWRSITKRFESLPEPIEHYRDSIIGQAKTSWERFRCEISRKYVKPFIGDKNSCIEHLPEEYSMEDWVYILDNHFLKDEFRARSERSSKNREKLQLQHHAGSVSFTQVEKKMRATGKAPTHIELFDETHSRKGTGEGSSRVVEPYVQEKVDAMSQTLESNPEMTNHELTESVFGRQGHGRVIGMGSGVRPTHFRGDLRRSQSQQRETQNQELQRMRAEQVDSARRIQELEEQMELQRRQHQELQDQL